MKILECTIMIEDYSRCNNSFWVGIMDVVGRACLCCCGALIWWNSYLSNRIFISHFTGLACEWTFISPAFDIDCLLQLTVITNKCTGVLNFLLYLVFIQKNFIVYLRELCLSHSATLKRNRSIVQFIHINNKQLATCMCLYTNNDKRLTTPSI